MGRRKQSKQQKNTNNPLTSLLALKLILGAWSGLNVLIVSWILGVFDFALAMNVEFRILGCH
jgi:hypothetical protein